MNSIKEWKNNGKVKIKFIFLRLLHVAYFYFFFLSNPQTIDEGNLQYSEPLRENIPTGDKRACDGLLGRQAPVSCHRKDPAGWADFRCLPGARDGKLLARLMNFI